MNFMCMELGIKNLIHNYYKLKHIFFILDYVNKIHVYKKQKII